MFEEEHEVVLRQVLDLLDQLDSPQASGAVVVKYLEQFGAPDAEISTRVLGGKNGTTDAVKVLIKGSQGRSVGGTAPTLGIVGRLGGLGARPERIGFVSDGDGALSALAAAAKLLDMQAKGDVLKGDVIVATHVCPHAPTRPHEPVPFMDSPIDMAEANAAEVLPEMEAIISIDTTRGNRVINHTGICISNTVMQGYILRISESLIDILQTVTGEPAVVFPLSTQDITPYENGLYHLNSILQPATATKAPVVGLALTTRTAVAGCATGATREMDSALAATFAIETAKYYGEGKVSFYDPDEFGAMVRLYGDATRFQTPGVTGGGCCC